jgi:hypothetical protein
MGGPVPGVSVGDAANVLDATRRKLFGMLGKAITSGSLVRFMSHGVAAGGGYWTKATWFHDLSFQDFSIVSDDSRLTVDRAESAQLQFTVERTFRLQAKKSGSFAFSRSNPGVSYKEHDCTIKQGGRSDELIVESPGAGSYKGMVTGPKIHLGQGDHVDIHLLSTEKYYVARGFYSLKLSGPIGNSTIAWKYAPELARLAVQGRIYSESANSSIELLVPDRPKTTAELPDGINLLLTWNA